MLGPDGLWGDWRRAPYVEGQVRAALEVLETRLERDLAAYGTAADRFCLIHADMRLANLLVDDRRLVLIDFDDCGFGWMVYDFAAAVSFIETKPELPALRTAWVQGYRSVRTLADEHLAMIDTMILLRRMVLLAWIGSHADTALARSHAPNFARDTARLAELYAARA